MICYFILLFFSLITIYSQQTDECNNKDLTQYQFDLMNITEQETLVNKLLGYRISSEFFNVFSIN